MGPAVIGQQHDSIRLSQHRFNGVAKFHALVFNSLRKVVKLFLGKLNIRIAWRVIDGRNLKLLKILVTGDIDNFGKIGAVDRKPDHSYPKNLPVSSARDGLPGSQTDTQTQRNQSFYKFPPDQVTGI